MHKGRAPETCWTVVLCGDRLDPEQAQALKAFQDVQRSFKKCLRLIETFQRIWHKRHQWEYLLLARGRVYRFSHFLQKWDWQWQSPLFILRPCGRPLHRLHDSSNWISEQIKAARRENIITNLHERPKPREDMEGLTTSDWVAATALHTSRTLKNLRLHGPLQRALLADLVTGSF